MQNSSQSEDLKNFVATDFGLMQNVHVFAFTYDICLICLFEHQSKFDMNVLIKDEVLSALIRGDADQRLSLLPLHNIVLSSCLSAFSCFTQSTT